MSGLFYQLSLNKTNRMEYSTALAYSAVKMNNSLCMYGESRLKLGLCNFCKRKAMVIEERNDGMKLSKQIAMYIAPKSTNEPRHYRPGAGTKKQLLKSAAESDLSHNCFYAKCFRLNFDF